MKRNPYGHGDFFLLSGTGCRRDPITGRFTRHCGIDLAGIATKQICSLSAGRVLLAGEGFPGTEGLGRCIEILGVDQCRVLYAGLSILLVSEGDFVENGQKIGYEGMMPREPGMHLHLEVRKNGNLLPPADYLEIEGGPGRIRGSCVSGKNVI